MKVMTLDSSDGLRGLGDADLGAAQAELADAMAAAKAAADADQIAPGTYEDLARRYRGLLERFDTASTPKAREQLVADVARFAKRAERAIGGTRPWVIWTVAGLGGLALAGGTLWLAHQRGLLRKRKCAARYKSGPKKGRCKRFKRVRI